MNTTVLKAIFKRDFVSYFSNPTGYVFICVFVMLSALAAFWPPEFFSNNLANLDQLNKWLPFIMLVFIPAITMSIWAEERRQGTDELLLTLPASDLDVVLGKYLAAVAIYSVSLLFSMFAIYLVFSWGLGTPDGGLFLGTYVGYWFIGLAMVSIGMVASFLTKNLTVGFTLGMLFNLPLAMFGVADWFIKNPQLAQSLKHWSAIEQFRDFERGVISLAGMSYFVLVAVVMLYVSMVLISRRHWTGREERGEAMWAHYTLRALSLLMLAVGVSLFLSHHNSLRLDITSEKLNSLSPRTVKLVEELSENPDVKTIKIDAYVSPQVPADYAAHKLNLLSTLNELSSLGGGKIVVDVHEIENFSEEAARAEQQLRHRAAGSVGHQSRRAHPTRDFSGGRLHVRPGQSRDPVHRQRHPRRVRAGAIDRNRGRAEAQKARRVEDRRGAIRRVHDARTGRRVGIDSRTSQTIRRGGGRPREADPTTVRCAAGRAAVVAIAGGDGQFRRGGEIGAADRHF